jgi:superfamily II DNA/RNA helicase
MIIGGKSIIARAKNGTGKSGAFLIPIINQIKEQSNKLQGTLGVMQR